MHIELRNVSHEFELETGFLPVLENLSFSVPKGKFTAIMGPSGSGKSTLMHCSAGVDDLTSGTVHIGETELGSLSDKDLTLLRRNKVGFVFQAFNLLPTLTAKENTTLPLDLAGTKPDNEWMDQVLQAVGIADRLKHRPDELSGGQQQRVAVARALVSTPEIGFADEPPGNLDSKTGDEVLDFLRRAVEELNQTMVIVTHDAQAAARAHRVLFLGDGKIVDEMTDPTADMILHNIKNFSN